MGAALSCVRAGLSTWGADLNSNACATLKEAGACGVSDNAATFAEKLDALLVLVVNAAQVKQVLFGETGVAQHLKPGTAVMVSSTIASADAQEIATALAGFDLEMLDAPVSGGAVKAANGEMTVMASGTILPLNDWHPCWKPLPESLSHRCRTGTRFDRKNYSPVVSGRTYCCRSRSDGTCSPCGDPAGCDV
ncbi:oxidoreductase YgbJ [Escherichia coli]|uniref:Oxidoreductase YgbJ n=1 Tax=Escherichia coli TaxID=562 RepID=A0A376RE72_ECOLX|nr:oxidoreductase YgbJ [Escherichia coli]